MMPKIRCGAFTTPKRRKTSQVIGVLTDPASAGEGGDPDEPLLLVQKLALDEPDVEFGAYNSRFLKRVPDAAAWSPLPGGFDRWLSKYHRDVLRGTRPVLIAVHVREGLCPSLLVFCSS